MHEEPRLKNGFSDVVDERVLDCSEDVSKKTSALETVEDMVQRVDEVQLDRWLNAG